MRRPVIVIAAAVTMLLGACSSPGDPASGDTIPPPGSVVERPSTGTGTFPTLAYVNNGIQLSSLTGSTPRPLHPGDPVGKDHPDWSPDGGMVAFDAGSSAIWIVDATGGGLTRLYSCVSPCAAVQDPAWSPDGRTVAFMTVLTRDGRNTSQAAIVVLDLATGHVRTVYADASGRDWIFGPRWSPDGRSIVFQEDTFVTTSLSEDRVARARIGIVGADGGSTPRFVAAGAAARQPATPDWSPRGDLIVFVQDDDLVTLRPDGTHRRRLTRYGPSRHAIQPSFTPDGSRIVFSYVKTQVGVNDSPTASLIGLDGSGFTTLVDGATHPRIRP